MTPAEKLAKKLNGSRRPRRGSDFNGPVICHVRAVRESVGIAMHAACEAMGFSPAGMSAIERGGDCVMTTALRIAAFYGKPIHELWEPKPAKKTKTN